MASMAHVDDSVVLPPSFSKTHWPMVKVATSAAASGVRRRRFNRIGGQGGGQGLGPLLAWLHHARHSVVCCSPPLRNSYYCKVY